MGTRPLPEDKKQKICEMVEAGLPPNKIARLVGCGVGSVYRHSDPEKYQIILDRKREKRKRLKGETNAAQEAAGPQVCRIKNRDARCSGYVAWYCGRPLCRVHTADLAKAQALADGREQHALYTD